MTELNLDINGKVVKVETEVSSVQKQAGLEDEVTAKFDEAMDIVRQLATVFTTSINELADQFCPHETSLTFGLKVQAESNWVVAKAGGEANFQISLKWNPKKERT